MENNIIFLLKQLNLSLDQYRKERMKNMDISPSESLALDYLLSQKSHTLYATELHEKFGISKSTISTTLKGLKRKGYLKTVVNPQDDRKKQIILTDKAYEMEQRINAGLWEQQEYLCREISQQQMEILKTGLNIMLQNIKPESVRRNRV